MSSPLNRLWRCWALTFDYAHHHVMCSLQWKWRKTGLWAESEILGDCQGQNTWDWIWFPKLYRWQKCGTALWYILKERVLSIWCWLSHTCYSIVKCIGRSIAKGWGACTNAFCERRGGNPTFDLFKRPACFSMVVITCPQVLECWRLWSNGGL